MLGWKQIVLSLTLKVPSHLLKHLYRSVFYRTWQFPWDIEFWILRRPIIITIFCLNVVYFPEFFRIALVYGQCLSSSILRTQHTIQCWHQVLLEPSLYVVCSLDKTPKLIFLLMCKSWLSMSVVKIFNNISRTIGDIVNSIQHQCALPFCVYRSWKSLKTKVNKTGKVRAYSLTLRRFRVTIMAVKKTISITYS